MSNPTHFRHIQWLTSLLAIVTCIALLFLYLLWTPVTDNRFGQLVMNFIPSAMVALLAIPLVYFLFTQHGINLTPALDEEGVKRAVKGSIDLLPAATIDVTSLADEIAAHIGAQSMETQQRSPEGPDLEVYLNGFTGAQNRIRELTPQHKQLAGRSIFGTHFQIVNDGIQKSVADVVVSSDDNFLQAKGGVARAILDAAGRLVEIELQRQRAFARRQGDIAITSGGNLEARAIIHPAVIAFDPIAYPTEAVVEQIVHRCLDAAMALGAKSVAFPVLGGGTGAAQDFRPWTSITSIVNTTVSWLAKNGEAARFESVTLCIFDDRDVAGSLEDIIGQAMDNIVRTQEAG